MAETESLTNTSQPSLLDQAYTQYQNELRQKIVGVSNQSEISKGIMSGEITKEDINKLKQETITPQDFRSYYYPKELPLEVEVRRRYRKNILLGKGYGGYIDIFQVLPDGDIISGETDKKIYLWQKKDDGNYEQILVGSHEQRVMAIQTLPNGDIVSGSLDCNIYLWQKKNDGSYKRTLVGNNKDWINTLQVLPDGDIVSGGRNGNICLWKKGSDKNYKLISIGTCKGSVETLKVLPNGDIFSAAFSKVFLWSREKDGSYRQGILIGDGYINVIQNLSNGDLVLEGMNNNIYLWKLVNNSNKTYVKKEVGQNGKSISTLQALTNGDMVFGDRNGDIYLWKVKEDGSYKRKLIKKGTGVVVDDLQILPDSSIIFSSGGELRMLK
jgi:WD40 repeat protein